MGWSRRLNGIGERYSLNPILILRWISEKMDGVRAYWNGEKLLSRHDKKFECPDWFIEGIPKGLKLDG